MKQRDLEDAGRELLILETLANISSYRQEIEGYQQRYGSFERVEAAANAVGEEDFELDDAHNAWCWARERLEELQETLKTLQSDAA